MARTWFGEGQEAGLDRVATQVLGFSVTRRFSDDEEEHGGLGSSMMKKSSDDEEV